MLSADDSIIKGPSNVTFHLDHGDVCREEYYLAGNCPVCWMKIRQLEAYGHLLVDEFQIRQLC